MEIFWSDNISGGLCSLNAEESAHCVKVLRHRSGDEINVIDGAGTMYRCRLVLDSPKNAEAEIIESFPGWGSHRYNLTMAVCPTKNNDRYEWFVEKAVEAGVDRIVPVIGDHSERKVFKEDRLKKIVLSASKQSMKSAFPGIDSPIGVKDFILSMKDSPALKMIAYCFEDGTPRISITEAMGSYDGHDYVVMIGPEGDFSREEASLALECGFRPVHIGASRLRTETAAVAAVMAVYLKNL